MTYTLEDVDRAEAYIRSTRPDLLIARGDYDYSLSIANKPRHLAVVLFRVAREENGQSEVVTSLEEIKEICLLYGEKWTAEQMKKILAARVRTP